MFCTTLNWELKWFSTLRIEVEWGETFEYTPKEWEVLEAWMIVSWEDGNYIFTHSSEQLADIKSKQQKEDIESVASLSDQINLIASVLDTLTSEAPDPTIIAWAKAKFSEIKNILNK